jgi:type I restriction enzyme S subunit
MRLKHVADVRVSNVDKKSADGEISIRLCNYTDVYYNDRITSSLDFMSATATPDQCESFQLREGDVLITKDSETAEDIGISAYVTESLPRVLCGYHLALVRPRAHAVDGRYLRWALASAEARAQMASSATGVTRFGMRSSAIAQVSVPVPDPELQHRIADYLDGETARMDRIIQRRHRLIDLFSQLTRSRVAALLDDVSSRGGVDIPLRAVLRPRKTADLPDLEVLSVFREYGVVPKSSREGNYNKTPEDLTRYQLVESGDVVINKMKAWQGSLGVSTHRGIVSPDYLVCEVIYPVDRTYLYWFLRSPQMIARFTERSTGIRPAQWRLYWQDLKELWIRLPDASTQKALGNEMTHARAHDLEAIETAERQIALLEERRYALVDAAVNGRLNIPKAA